MKYLLILSMYIALSAGDNRITENTTISKEHNTLDDCELDALFSRISLEVNNRKRATDMRFKVDKFNLWHKCVELKTDV